MVSTKIHKILDSTTTYTTINQNHQSTSRGRDRERYCEILRERETKMAGYSTQVS